MKPFCIMLVFLFSHSHRGRKKSQSLMKISIRQPFNIPLKARVSFLWKTVKMKSFRRKHRKTIVYKWSFRWEHFWPPAILLPLLCHFIASLERHENPIKGDIESRPTSKKAQKEEKSFPAEEILEYLSEKVLFCLCRISFQNSSKDNFTGSTQFPSIPRNVFSR